MMMELAVAKEDSYVGLSKIARQENISLKFLENIIGQIKPLGVVDVKRGKLGGYRLAKPASSIKLLEIFEVLDNTFLDFNNMHESPEELTASQKVLMNTWGGLKESMKEYLKTKTLADLVAEYKKA